MPDLLEEREGRMVTLTLNRPDRLNAMSSDMMDGLMEALPRLAKDPEVGCVVLTGAGRGFCAGGDVKAMAENSGEITLESRVQGLRERMETSRWLHEIPVPTIAMIRGPVAGAGLSMALACDMRIADTTARFITAFRNVGFSGDFGGSYFLSKLVGTAKARELYYTADRVEAPEALSLGIINRLVEPDALAEETQSLARKIADGPPIALRYMKRNMNAAESGDLQTLLDMEAMHHARCSMTDDHKEAAAAFVEKRQPIFKGQ